MAKKTAKIPDGVLYPPDLYGELKGLWDNKPVFPDLPKVELPPKPLFDKIINVCYQASMLTEEGRPTIFRIVFLNNQSRVSPRDDDEPRYLLKEPVPFTLDELRRLAPVARPAASSNRGQAVRETAANLRPSQHLVVARSGDPCHNGGKQADTVKIVVARSPDRATKPDRRSPEPPETSIVAATKMRGVLQGTGDLRSGHCGTVRRPCHNEWAMVARSGDRATTGCHNGSRDRTTTGGKQADTVKTSQLSLLQGHPNWLCWDKAANFKAFHVCVETLTRSVSEDGAAPRLRFGLVWLITQK